MLVDRLMYDEGPADYYDPAFRNVLEDHMTYLRTDSKTQMIAIDPARAYKFEFDLYSLFASYNLPAHLHWVTMRLNSMLSPTELTRDLGTLLVPDTLTIERIRQAHVTTRRIN